jgi:hypothetical protein
MAEKYRRIGSDRVKHLEMIQAVITRLASEAALSKGWALTVSSGLFGFAAHSLSPWVAAVGILLVLAFWWLSAYYLRAERQYRSLFDRVRKCDETVEIFCMDARGERGASWRKILCSPTLGIFYGVIVFVGAIILAVSICAS